MYVWVCVCVCMCVRAGAWLRGCVYVCVCCCVYLHAGVYFTIEFRQVGRAHLLVGGEVLKVLERLAPWDMFGSVRLQGVARVVCSLHVDSNESCRTCRCGAKSHTGDMAHDT